MLLQFNIKINDMCPWYNWCFNAYFKKKDINEKDGTIFTRYWVSNIFKELDLLDRAPDEL